MGCTKSDTEVNRLVNSVLLNPDFKLEDLQGFNVASENQRGNAVEKNLPFPTLFKWLTSTFKFLLVPEEYHQAHFLFQVWSIGN